MIVLIDEDETYEEKSDSDFRDINERRAENILNKKAIF